MNGNITLRTRDEARNLIDLPNVYIDYVDLKIPRDGGVIKTNFYLSETLYDIVSNRPDWRFIVDAVVDKNNLVKTITGFTIKEGNDELGSVRISYEGSAYKIVVNNARIASARKRGKYYTTTAPARAALAIRRNFFADSNAERLAKVAKQAEAVLDVCLGTFKSNVNTAQYRFFSKAHQFVNANLSAYIAMFPEAEELHAAYKEKVAILETTEALQRYFNTHQCIFAIERNGDVYTTKSDSSIERFTSDTLPYEFRRKIGLLKLVEPHQIISGVGCRVDADAFVLMPSQEGDAE